MVFRFACELGETVEPDHLQTALEKTLGEFPTFRSILRRGLFWYYFEEGVMQARVEPETLPPCSTIYDRIQNKSLLFRVTYYRRRINLEVYHALSDGTGALQFLKTLVYHYLLMAHPGAFGDAPPLLDIDASDSQRADDSFDKYYTGPRGAVKIKNPRAYKLKGPLIPGARIRVLSGVLSVRAALALARRYHVTLSVFITSALIYAIHKEMPPRERKRPVCITIPVNLRKYFESASMRNFFGTFNVSFQSVSEVPLESIIPAVSEQFSRELDAERLSIRMQGMAAIEHNPFARAAPLFLKDWALRVGLSLSERGVTACVSNVGKITMPEVFTPYIRLFDAFISTKRIQLCMCSYQDRLVLGISTPFYSTEVQKRFFRTLAGMGLDIVVNSNPIDGTDAPARNGGPEGGKTNAPL